MSACRSCSEPVRETILDLGSHPPSNAYYATTPPEPLPLKVGVCTHCWLVQTEDVVGRDALFEPEYAYFSGYSTSWVAHCADYAEKIADRFDLDSDSVVAEIACNDGTLLRHFAAAGFNSVGVEPTASTAAAARDIGLHVVEEFFGADLAVDLLQKYGHADVIAANNVLAHVPDINDFMAGFATWLASDGVATFEFPHLVNLMAEGQFDTVYHEHYSYLSLTAIQKVIERAGLEIFDVERLTTHGGSLRVYVQQRDCERPVSGRVEDVLQSEHVAGVQSMEFYETLQTTANKIRDSVQDWFKALEPGSSVYGYGAAAKGNTLLNFCGLTDRDLSAVADANPHKQGKRLPGSGIPVVSPEQLFEENPDYIVVLPWNIFNEVKKIAHGEEPLCSSDLVRFIPKIEAASASD